MRAIYSGLQISATEEELSTAEGAEENKNDSVFFCVLRNSSPVASLRKPLSSRKILFGEQWQVMDSAFIGSLARRLLLAC